MTLSLMPPMVRNKGKSAPKNGNGLNQEQEGGDDKKGE